MPAKLWIEGPGEEPVWHHASRRLAAGRYESACARELLLRGGRVWPQKPGEPGPADAERCGECGAVEQDLGDA